MSYAMSYLLLGNIYGFPSIFWVGTRRLHPASISSIHFSPHRPWKQKHITHHQARQETTPSPHQRRGPGASTGASCRGSRSRSLSKPAATLPFSSFFSPRHKGGESRGAAGTQENCSMQALADDESIKPSPGTRAGPPGHLRGSCWLLPPQQRRARQARQAPHPDPRPH